MPRITLNTATPLRALQAWEGNLVIARNRWNKVTPLQIKEDMAMYDATAIECFERYVGTWPEFYALGLRVGEDGLEAHQWHDGMGEMLDLLPEHWHLEFVDARGLSLLLFGTPYMFEPKGRGLNGAGRHRTYEFRYHNIFGAMTMRIEEQLSDVRARMVVLGAKRREAQNDKLS